MEQQKLPNATLILVLGIFGYVCCCFAGIGIIPSAIAFIMARKSEKIYAENPELYDNISQIKTGKIVALIALILSALVAIRWIYVISTGDWDAILEQSREMMEQYGIEE
ncbi:MULTISPECIES: CCC motif membrane protein [Ulvibacterium]|uniref:DUF4190 domain-containing protein n=1 Tax=Ulvibacterium marinum TaxID=2419782 RepID=A0A3B0BZQ6_9FLAO|nr:CCC motif membrane protein [Ulvibacterium marinum]RKN76766.1 DUF4190 domain-containing protein [Ulvibacterium marinum]